MEKTEKALFKVVGMYCTSCKPIVEKQLKDEQAVKKIDIDLQGISLFETLINIEFFSFCFLFASRNFSLRHPYDAYYPYQIVLG